MQHFSRPKNDTAFAVIYFQFWIQYVGLYIVEFGEAIKNPAYRILQTEYSGCLDISAHA